MELTHSRHLPADRQSVWDALTDPEKLRAAIPGCESIERTGDNEFRLTMAATIGPVKARFVGKLTLTDIVPPERYTLTFEGQGGAAGFARGTARVTLRPEDGGTRFEDSVSAQVGGRLAQAGQRLIDAAAGKLADEFFSALASSLAGDRRIVSNEASPSAPRASWRLLLVAGAALAALLVALGFAMR